MNTRAMGIGVCLGWLALGVGCATHQSQMGVRNVWRDAPAPPFAKGSSTQADVMAALGPPSQIIGLTDQTVFYYLREQAKSKGLFLILYNQTRENVDYDRAIFFFDRQGILTDFAYSAEVVAP